MALMYSIFSSSARLGQTPIGHQAMRYALFWAKKHGCSVTVTAEIVSTGDSRSVEVMPDGSINKLWA